MGEAKRRRAEIAQLKRHNAAVKAARDAAHAILVVDPRGDMAAARAARDAYAAVGEIG